MSNKFDKLLIGEFDVNETALNEERIDNNNLDLKKIGTCKIYVYSGEGPIPHCHLIPDNPTKLFAEACIRLDSCDYFPHGYKTSTLSSKQAKEFDTWCREKNTKFKSSKEKNWNNWETMCGAWNYANPDKSVSKLIQPDYSNLP